MAYGEGDFTRIEDRKFFRKGTLSHHIAVGAAYTSLMEATSGLLFYTTTGHWYTVLGLIAESISLGK